MGTKGLLKVASSLFTHISLTMWAGMTVGIDASMVIHQLLTRYALSIMAGDWTDFLKAIVERIMIVKRARCVPLLVFDGRRVSAKVANASRAERRARSLEELNMQSEAVRCLQEMLKTLSDDLEDAVHADNGGRVEDILKKSSEGATAVREGVKKMKSAVDQGIGAFAVEAAERVQEACRAHGITFHVARYESETHLVALQRAKEVDAIIGFDSDYITIGADNVMLDPAWSLGGGKVYSHKSPKSPKPGSPFADAVKRFGLCVFRLSSYFLKNDYSSIEGVGPRTLEHAWELLGKRLDDMTPPSLESLASCVWEASSGGVRSKNELKDIARAAQRAAAMFHCQETYFSGRMERGPLPSDCGDIDRIFEQQSDLVDDFFSEFTKEMLEDWLRGKYSITSPDPKNLLPTASRGVPEALIARPRVVAIPTSDEIAAMTKDAASSLAHTLGLGKMTTSKADDVREAVVCRSEGLH